MEASAAAIQSAGDGGGEGQPTEAPRGAEAPESGGLDTSAIQERMDEFGQRFDTIEPLLRQMAESSQQPAEPGQPEQPEQSFEERLAEYADEQGTVTGEGLERFMQSEIERGIQQGVEEKVAPLLERLQGVETYLVQEDLESLKDDYPELENPEKEQALTAEVKQAVERWGAPHLAANAEFVEAMYLAGWARERAGQEGTGGDEQGATIEGPGGGSPSEPERDPAQAILEASGPRPSWA